MPHEVAVAEVCGGHCLRDHEGEPDCIALVRHGVRRNDAMTKGRKALEAARNGGTIREDGDCGEYFFVSCVPWLHYTSMTQPVPQPAYSNVRLAWGRCVTENGRTSLPVTVLAHHALVDGIHLGKFYEELEKRVSEAR